MSEIDSVFPLAPYIPTNCRWSRTAVCSVSALLQVAGLRAQYVARFRALLSGELAA